MWDLFIIYGLVLMCITIIVLITLLITNGLNKFDYKDNKKKIGKMKIKMEIELEAGDSLIIKFETKNGDITVKEVKDHKVVDSNTKYDENYLPPIPEGRIFE